MSGGTLKPGIRWFGKALLLAALLPASAGADIDALPLHVAVAEQAAIARAGQASGHGPLRFAVTAPVGVGLDGGVWEALDGDALRWRTRITSPGALSLSLRLDAFAGAPEARLWIRGAETGMTQGPYDIDDVDAEGRLWTAMVFEDTVVVDLLVPATQRDALALRIGGAHHGFRDLRKQLRPGDSGSCNIDVACAQGDDWRDQARSVAGLTFDVDGQGVFCTGNLVNNSAQDGDPLVLTGHHCEVRASNAGSVVAYWNFQAESCNGDKAAFDQSQNGATLVATHEGSDHTLLRLDETPDEAFGVFYTGWDAGADAALGSGATLHHPQADFKKISLFNSPARKEVQTIEQQTVQIWRVTWDQGTTEQGSSGAGLWNADRMLVGVLFGGQASCDSPNAPDFYGRLEVAWEGGGTSDSHMRSCLDKTASGDRQLDGVDASELAAPGEPAPEIQACQEILGNSENGNGSGGGTFWAPLLALAALLRRKRAPIARG